ncbi:MAG: bL17 family ribosomal protein [Candidatus Peribacteraceae bacterium]|nr:bL17 family ribosomal protein [Candidatus Peribacteraceae bacterium]
MRHRKSRNRLKQKPGHARMVKRNLLTSLLLYESVRTTKKRAAVVAPQVDKLINYAKTHSPHVAIRHINKTVTDKNASKKIMEVFTKRYAKKSSGLTRTKAAGFRVGDGAHVVDISLVEGEVVETPPPAPAKTPAK